MKKPQSKLLRSSLLVPPLGKEEVQVFFITLDHWNIASKELWEILSLEEKRRAKRFYFMQDLEWYVCRQGILRILLGHYLNIQPNDIEFEYGPYGKPFVNASYGQICFNLSHSNGLASYAFAKDRDLGIDIERLGPLPDALRVVQQVFSTQERLELSQLPESLKLQAFFHGWTRKEAYIKAIGEGLSHRLNSFSVSLGLEEPITLVFHGQQNREKVWLLKHLVPKNGFICALCVEGDNWTLRQLNYCCCLC